MIVQATADIAPDEVHVNMPRLKARWEMARRDPLFFLRWFVYTVDQHDELEPVKKFPWHKPHLQKLTQLWIDNPLMCVKKSRQMVVTWWAVAMTVWDTMFHRGKLWMMQSKREEDALGDRYAGDGLLGRALFILDHIPGRQWLVPAWQLAKGNRVVFPALNSAMWAIPQGAAIIRQRTASGILSDESGFQEEFADSYVAARPCVRGGGRFLAVSTANPGFFDDLVEDNIQRDEGV